jgi:hypothetical protein
MKLTVNNRSGVYAWNIRATFKMEAEDRNYQNKQKVQQFVQEVDNCIIDDGG